MTDDWTPDARTPSYAIENVASELHRLSDWIVKFMPRTHEWAETAGMVESASRRLAQEATR